MTSSTPAVKTDWSYLSYHLATRGIPSTVDEDVAENPTDDPWAPRDGEEIVVVRMSKDDASWLAALVDAALAEVTREGTL